MKAPILTDAQWEHAFAQVSLMQRPKHYRLLMLLVRKLGLRPMELAGMQSNWFRMGELRIPLGHSKRKSGRSLPVDAELEQALAEHLQGRTGYVFLNQDGEPFKPGLMSASIARVFKEAGMWGSAYSGRRGGAQRLLDNGENILTIQAYLGHSSPMTTLAYVGVSQVQLARALYA